MIRSTLAALIVGMLSFQSARADMILPDSQISFTGYVQAQGSVSLNAATGLSFAGSDGTVSGNSGTLSSYGAGYGTFAGFSCGNGNCGSIQNIDNLTLGGQTISNFVSFVGGNNGDPINFTLEGITSIDRSNPNSLVFNAFGLIDYQSYDSTPADFILSTQGNRLVSFSATTSVIDGFGTPGGSTPVPEPVSMAILGSALVGVGLLRSKNRK